MSTCNRLDLQALGSQPIMPKNLPNHCPISKPDLHIVCVYMNIFEAWILHSHSKVESDRDMHQLREWVLVLVEFVFFEYP